jgi:hypothetical protein
MTLGCVTRHWFGYTDGALVARGDRWHIKCLACDRLSPGVRIDGPKPRVTQPKAPRSRIWWVRGIYSSSKGA